MNDPTQEQNHKKVIISLKERAGFVGTSKKKLFERKRRIF